MPNINITVAEKNAINMSPGVHIVCGNSDYTATFTFDAEWEAQAEKIARFVFVKDGETHYIDAEITDNVAKVPRLSNISAVLVGAYAGELQTTTPARVLCDRSILCGSGKEYVSDDNREALAALIARIEADLASGAYIGPRGYTGMNGKNVYPCTYAGAISTTGGTITNASQYFRLALNPITNGDMFVTANGYICCANRVTMVTPDEYNINYSYLCRIEGARGYTPKKGTDYWTDADKAEIVEEVVETLGAPIEPAADDIPKVFINGAIPTTKDDVYAEMEYISKTERFKAYLKIKCQGSSSMSYGKKNFTIKLYSDEARETKLEKTFKDWGNASSKFVLKANYIDHSHARNIVCANLWDEVVESRADYNTLPEEMRNSPRNGAIDGFPVKVYTNGTYQGLYTWNIGKDAWMWGMDEDNADHVLLCGELNTNGVYAETAGNFRALWPGTDGEYWSVEVGTNSDAVKNSLNALIACVKDTDDATFKTDISNYLDVQSAIDYWLHQYVICGLDGLAKNMLLATYNGTRWICGAYDLDSTFGMWWNGAKFVSAEYRCPEDYQEPYSLLWERLATLYSEEIKTRYTELRNTVYSYANMANRFERFTDIIGKDLYAEDLEVYPGIPSGDTNNIKQIRNFIRDRLYYCDVQFGLIEESTEIDYTLNPLANVAWVDGYTYNNTYGTYEASGGEHCTPKFKLQDCVYEFKFTDAGTYGALFIWDEDGNHVATKQEMNWNFTFSANSNFTYALKVYQPSGFNSNLVSLMPKDNRENMTTPVSITLAERNWIVSGRGDVETDLGVLFSGVGDMKVNDFVNSVSGAVLTLNNNTMPWNVAKENDVFVGALAGGGYCYLSTNMFSDVESAMAYFQEHNTTITFNG